jgi:hypothetical protein
MTDIQPLTLPENFNPETYMLVKTTEYGTFHESRQAARLAGQLVANGAEQDLALAEKVLEATLKCQELDERDPHYGNFYWMREDDIVEDLNAVEFVLEHLIPMMIRHSDRLPPELRQRVREAIRLGLAEIERLDVLVAYTNITALDILNSCLGGELLADTALAGRGYRKLREWIAFTNRSGHPLEFNSPTYIAVTIRALKQLVDLVQAEDTRLRARALVARLALSVALHLHTGTGRWAGPHSRAYHPSVVCETPPEIEMMRGWLDDGAVPAWIADVLEHRPAMFQVTETAEQSQQIGLTTYHSESFALGVASRTLHAQANACLLHYRRPQAGRPGVMYTRYIVDDKWFGDSYHATDRTKTRNLLDEGEFYGVQHGGKAICLYAPTNFREGTAAKAVVIWTQQEHIAEIWLDGQRIEQLPARIPPETVLVIASGEVYIAVRPLTVTPLGRETPLQLLERDGDLVFEMVNYRGPYKRFWELRWPGAFYQGRPFCAFYLEVAERESYQDGNAFAQAVAGGIFSQALDAPFTYPAEGERSYTVSYQRGSTELGISIELMQWQLLRRWTEASDPGWEMLASPMAVQNSTGRVEVGEAILTCANEPAWLYANPDTGRWVAGYLGLNPTTLRLTTPQGAVTVDSMGMGTVVWDNGEVKVEAMGNFTVTIDR